MHTVPKLPSLCSLCSLLLFCLLLTLAVSHFIIYSFSNPICVTQSCRAVDIYLDFFFCSTHYYSAVVQYVCVVLFVVPFGSCGLIREWTISAPFLILFPSFLLVFPHIPEVLLIYQLSITIMEGKSKEKVRRVKSHAHKHTEKETSLSKLNHSK